MKVVNGGNWLDQYNGMMHSEPSDFENLFTSAAAYEGKEIVPMDWVIGTMIPANTVTLLSGDGGTGKSLLALNLAISVATGGLLPWLGFKPQKGPALYVGAEDDQNEMHRRINNMIWNRPDIGFADLKDLHIASLAARDALLSVVDARSNILTPSPLFKQIRDKIDAERPRLVIFDTLADLFPGNENDRAQARQFIGQLRKLSVDFSTTIILLSHPSLSGMASGTGTSGNTAWNNSVRSRLFMQRVKEDGYEPDKTARKLTVMKSNYGESGLEVHMNYVEGFFEPEKTMDSLDRSSMDAKAERIYLMLLDEYTKASIEVSPNFSSNNSAATVFARSDQREGITKAQFKSAQERLQLAGKIWMGERGPASKRVKYVVKGSRPE
jgi:RecA-family ATPase